VLARRRDTVAPPEPALVYDPPAELPAPDACARRAASTARSAALGPRADPGVAGYVVESALAEAGPFRVRATLRDRGVLAWVDRGDVAEALGDGATRFYRPARVRARRTRLVDGVGGRLATSAPLPDPPEGLRAWSRQPRSIPLTWDPSSSPIVAGYIVERSPNPGGPFEVIAELDGRQSTHLLDTGLGDLRVLYYRVSARNSAATAACRARCCAQ
jgi:hypothetical protein